MSRVYKYGDNVDTDVIIPARYLNAPSPEELAKHCMEDIDADFAATVQPGARIFYRNAINIGFPILECPEAAQEINDGDDVDVNFDTGVITDNTTGKTFKANPLPPFIGRIVAQGGLLPYLKAKIEGEA